MGLKVDPRPAKNHSVNRRFVEAFATSPHKFFAAWGGATGLAGKFMSAAMAHAPFSAVVDIGCNQGDYTSQWLRRAPSLLHLPPSIFLCVEAVPSLAAATRKRLDRELAKRPPLADVRVAVVNAALSNETVGRRPLFGLPSTAKASARQTGAGLSHASAESGHVRIGEVETTTLDTLLRSWKLLQGGRVFVKVDVEGFDAHVLAGGACALRHGAIDAIQLEWNRRKLPSAAPPCVTLKRVAAFLERMGYEAFLVGQPYVPLNFGHWHASYEGSATPKLRCPPYCTGDIVALRRAWAAREPVVAALTAVAAHGEAKGFLQRQQVRGAHGRGPAQGGGRTVLAPAGGGPHTHRAPTGMGTAWSTIRPRVLSPFAIPHRTGRRDFTHSRS